METSIPAHVGRTAGRTLGLAAVPALLLAVTACGGDDGGDSTGAAFCDGAESLSAAAEGIDEPTDEQRAELYEGLAALDPPDEIADEWTLLVGSLDPENLEAGPSGDPADLQTATEAVDRYLEEECDLA